MSKVVCLGISTTAADFLEAGVTLVTIVLFTIEVIISRGKLAFNLRTLGGKAFEPRGGCLF